MVNVTRVKQRGSGQSFYCTWTVGEEGQLANERVSVTLGRIRRDYAKSPIAHVIVDLHETKEPGAGTMRVFRGRLGLESRSGVKDCVRDCKRHNKAAPWDDIIDGICDKALDRLTHRVHILEMNGESYRLKQSRQAAPVRAASDPADA